MNRFSNDRLQEIRDIFSQHENEMERIKADSVRDVLRNMGYNPTDYFLEMVTCRADTDEPYIDFEEFVGIIDKIEDDKKTNKDVQDAFNAFDFLGRGYVSSFDIKEALSHVTEKAPQHQRDDIIRFFKLDKNRKIYFKEFKDMIIMKHGEK